MSGSKESTAGYSNNGGTPEPETSTIGRLGAALDAAKPALIVVSLGGIILLVIFPFMAPLLLWAAGCIVPGTITYIKFKETESASVMLALWCMAYVAVTIFIWWLRAR